MSAFKKLSFLDCVVCENILIDPVSLPCGKTICKTHADEFLIKCYFCQEQHIAPSNG